MSWTILSFCDFRLVFFGGLLVVIDMVRIESAFDQSGCWFWRFDGFIGWVVPGEGTLVEYSNLERIKRHEKVHSPHEWFVHSSSAEEGREVSSSLHPTARHPQLHIEQTATHA
jgi:hypothetical protein